MSIRPNQPLNPRLHYEARQRALISKMALGQARIRLEPPSQDRRPAHSHFAAELAERFQIRLSDDARKLLQPAKNNAEFVELLLEHDLDPDARRVLACAMPRRRALWWGCLTAWDALGKLVEGDGARLLKSISAYVVQPCDQHWRDVADAGKPIKRASLLGCLLFGTFVAHGSVIGPDKPRVPAPPHVFGRLLESAVYLSSVTKDVRNYRLHLREYIVLGQQIAAGGPPWANAAAVNVTAEGETA